METGNIAMFSLPVFPSAVIVGTAVAKTKLNLSFFPQRIDDKQHMTTV